MVARKDKVDAHKSTEEFIGPIEVCIPSCCKRMLYSTNNKKK